MTIREYIDKRCEETGIEKQCCWSCIEDKEMGYDDIDGCCCRHSQFFDEYCEGKGD
jgi:hypothetical protein